MLDSEIAVDDAFFAQAAEIMVLYVPDDSTAEDSALFLCREWNGGKGGEGVSAICDCKTGMTVELTSSISIRYNFHHHKSAERLAPTSHSAKQTWA